MKLLHVAFVFLTLLLGFSSSPVGAADAAYSTSDIITRSPLIDVRAFGAKGDGVTDSQPAIQKAIDYAYAKGGGTILIPTGVYILKTVTAPYYLLRLRDKVSVVGQGPGSVLKAGNGLRNATTGICILYNHTDYISNLTISNLTIDYNGANNLLLDGWPGSAIVNRTGGNIASEVMIRDVQFKGSAGHHFVWFGLTSEDARSTRNSVANCSFSECGLSIPGNQATDHSSIYMGSSNSSITNNTFSNANRDYVASAMELHGDNSVATGNTVTNYNHGINIGGDSNTIDTVAVTGNTFTAVVRGVVLWTMGSYTINNLSITDNAISVYDTEGTIYSPGGGIIYLGTFDTSTATPSGWVIANNVIKPAYVYTTSFAWTINGIAINPVTGLSITGNNISGMKAEGIRVETVVGKNHINTIVANNVITSCGYTSQSGRNRGLALLSNAATYYTTNLLVTGNAIVGGHYGAATDMAYGISFNFTAQFPSTLVSDNKIKGAVTFDIYTPTDQTVGSFVIKHVADISGHPLINAIRSTAGGIWIDPSTSQYFQAIVSASSGTSAVWRGTEYRNAVPASGQHYPGDRWVNTSPTVGQPKGGFCTTAGNPGTWVSEGNL